MHFDPLPLQVYTLASAGAVWGVWNATSTLTATFPAVSERLTSIGLTVGGCY